MNILQTQPAAGSENYFELLMKGGWIIVPLIILSFVAVYIIADKTVTLLKLGKKDQPWFNYIRDLVNTNDITGALKYSKERDYSYCKVIAEGIESYSKSDQEIQDNMQTEARVQIARLENKMNYLGIIAAVAPMMGFLGTIFGVIRIFYNIAITNDLSISSISDGLYQKMICSGVGLLVGIIAYSGYYILGGVVDSIVLNIDKTANDMLSSLRAYRKRNNIA